MAHPGVSKQSEGDAASPPAVPGYRIEGEIGRGAMSVVYRACRGHNVYALKLLKKNTIDRDPAAVRRFRHEAAALAQLEHPALISVVEAGEIDGQPYLVMELLEGATLEAQLARGRLSAEVVVSIGRQIAAGLGEVARRGLVHRDVKPANIIVADDGSAKLVDFGLVDDVLGLGQGHDDVLGSVLYAAPEQTGFLKRGVDGRADLYALGVVLFECLAGRPPFTADDAAQVMHQHAVTVPPSLRELRPETRPALAAIVAKLLAKDPDDRYQTGEELLGDLARLDELDAALAAKRPIRLGRRHAHGVLAPRHQVRFVARAGELSRLLRSWTQTVEGAGRAVLVAGESGSGKSRLCAEMIEAAGIDEVQLIAAKCHQSDRVPFGPLRDAIDGYLARAMRAADETKAQAVAKIRQAAGELAPVVKRLSPGLERVLADETPPVVVDDVQFYQALATFLQRLAGELDGAIFYLDDVQWIDPPTLNVIAHMATDLGSCPLLLLATSRNEPVNSEALDRFCEVGRVSQAERLTLNALTVTEVGQLVQSHLGGRPLDDQVVERVALLSNGNPFAIGEYVRSMIDEAVIRPKVDGWAVDQERLRALAHPKDVLQLVLRRVAGLSSETTRVLAVAALAGDDLDLQLLSRTVGDSAIVARALTEGARANLVHARSGDHYQFVHDRVREALVAGSEPEQRAGMHQALADAMAELYPASSEHAASLARHYLAGGAERHRPPLMEAALTAGEQALRDYADEEAHGFLLAALEAAGELADSPHELRIRESLGRACTRTGRTSAAVEHFEAALQKTTDPVAIGRLRAHLASVYGERMEHRKVWTECRKALAALGQPFPRSGLMRVVTGLWFAAAFALVEILGLRGGRARSGELIRRKMLSSVLSIAGFTAYYLLRKGLMVQLVARMAFNAHRIGARREAVKSLSTVGTFFGILRKPRMVQRYAWRAIRIAQQTGDQGLNALARRNLVLALHFCGESGLAERLAKEWLEQWAKWLAPRERILGVNGIALDRMQHGRVREALAIELPAIEVADRAELDSGAVNTRVVAAASLAILGRLDESRERQVEAEKLAARTPDDHWIWLWLLGHKALIQLEQDEIGDAFDQTCSQFERFNISVRKLPHHFRPYYLYLAYGRLRQLQAASAENRGAAAKRMRSALALLKASSKLPDKRCHYHVIQAALSRASRRWKRAEKTLQRAQALANTAGTEWGRFEVLAERARLERDQGRALEARQIADEARRMALASGWVSRARRVEREFDLGVDEEPSQAASSAIGGSYTWSSRSESKAERYLDALLQVAQATASTLEPTAHSRAALDEVVRVLGAERGFLLLKDERTEQLVLQTARDAQGSEVAADAVFSRTVVDKVASTREPIVLTGTAEGELLGSESAVAYGLRSIIAAPIVQRERLVGVLYLDSRLAKGMFTEDDVRILAAIASHMTVAMETARVARLEIERKELEKDLAITGAVQSLFMPRVLTRRTPAYSLSCFYRPAAHCGGDWIWYDDDKVVLELLVADVSGHGAPSAMVTAAAASCYRAFRSVNAHAPLDLLLGQMHGAIERLFRGEYTMTMSALQLLPESGELRWWSAGAPPLVVIDEDGHPTAIANAGGPMGSSAFELGERRRVLRPGERLMVFTDGLPELELPSGRQLGMRRLAGLMSKARPFEASAAVDFLVSEIDGLRSDLPQADDLAFAVVDRPPRGSK